MTVLTLELSPELYEQLHREAEILGESIQGVALNLLTERLSLLPSVAPMTERERVKEVLRAAGLLAELSPSEKEHAAQSTMSLEEVRVALDRSNGKP